MTDLLDPAALHAARTWATAHGHPQPDDRMLTAYGQVIAEQVRQATAPTPTTADLAGQVAWLYRNSTRMTQMRFDAMAAANYDYSRYTATMRQPVDQAALLAYVRREIAELEQEAAAIARQAGDGTATP